MDFKSIPVSYQPVYTWLWNATIDKEGIKKRIDEMYDSGIHGFYALGEPESFRPLLRRTYLKPEYMSPEYTDLVYYAYEYAKQKGMFCWLYNEGGFPSGMVCGQIREAHPELALKNIVKKTVTLPAGQPYKAPERLLCAFCGDARIKENAVFDSDVTIDGYVCEDSNLVTTSMRTDIAERENTDYFLEMTHERLLKRFGNAMGSDVVMMFDDEASMGSWTRGLDKLFLEKYGYDILDYAPYLAGKAIDSRESARAYSDYIMLCGEITRKNYFAPMKKWLNDHNMLSTGHLGGDNYAKSSYITRQGNIMSALRLYDVPGIDVIWSQITYPTEGKCCREGNEFFPLYASSAARQQGHTKCVSESFAVYGAHIVPEEMRFIINFQAVQGISIFNFMSMSYEKQDTRALQCRPVFIRDHVGMDCLGQINNYTARVSAIMQNSKADVRTALYYPTRTISSKSEWGLKAEQSFDDMGHMLMKNGVMFDIIDEDFVMNAKVENGVLKSEFVQYESVFVPYGEFEREEVVDILKKCNNTLIPCFERRYESTLARNLVFENGDEGYFICNTSGEEVSESVVIESEKVPYIVDLESGETMYCEHTAQNGKLCIPVQLLRGEAAMILLSDKQRSAVKSTEYRAVAEMSDITGYISRKYEIHPTDGITNTYYESGEPLTTGEWDKSFSGEVTYSFIVPEGVCADRIALGEVRHYAKIYVNGIKTAESTYPPYNADVTLKSGDKVNIVVANTPANVCHNAQFFDIKDIKDVGPYHKNMKIPEAKAAAGGLIGPVRLYKKV